MKPAVFLLLSYGAGLATGLLRFGDPGLVVPILSLGALWFWRRPGAVWVLASLLGRLAALLVLHAEGLQCTVRLPAGPVTFEARVVEPVSSEVGLGRISPHSAACRGEIDARWPNGAEAMAGTRVRVSGRWIQRQRTDGRAGGLLVIRRVDSLEAAPGPVDRIRNWLAHTTRALYGTRTPTVEALVLNRRGGMPAELRDRYARAGLVHILSISGFHVGVIVAWAVLAGRILGVPRTRATILAAALAFAYVVFLGWPPPAARAALLAGLAAQFHLRQRNPQAVSLLAVTALLVVLVDPWAVLDAGAWLSVAALGGALIFSRWSDRALGTGWGYRTLSASVGATLATAPITAAMFGMVSIAGVGLNFAAIPIAAIAVPGLLLSLIVSLFSTPAAAPLAAGSGALLGLLDQLAWWGGRWDGSAVIQPTGFPSAVPWLVVLSLAGWSIAGGTTRPVALRRGAIGLAGCVWLLLAVETWQNVGDAGSGLTLHFLDVGQGDAAVLRTPAGRWVMIDAGPRGDHDDAGRRVVAPFLARHRAGGIAVAVVSHAHADHLGGVPSVLERYPVSRVLEPAELVADPLYTGFLDELELLALPWYAARDGLRFELDGVRFTVLHPDTTWSEWRQDLNEDSVVLLVEYGQFRALFGGDAGLPVESRLAGRVGRVDVLKVGHHGSRSASSESWLAELEPLAAVISCGKGNRYGHPHPEILTRLATRGIGAWRTDLLGNITVTTDGRSFTIAGRGRRETFQTRGPLGDTRQPRHHD